MLKPCILSVAEPSHTLPSLALFALVSAAEITLRGDPDDQPLRAWLILAILIAGGWAAGSFHTLARLMAPDATHEERLKVWQGVVASIAAGVLGFLGVLHWTEWGRMGAYFVGFILAYAGTLALDGARDALISGLRAMFQAVVDRTGGPKKP